MKKEKKRKEKKTKECEEIEEQGGGERNLINSNKCKQ